MRLLPLWLPVFALAEPGPACEDELGNVVRAGGRVSRGCHTCVCGGGGEWECTGSCAKGCEADGREVKHNESKVFDDCVKCSCFDGHLACSALGCSRLACGGDHGEPIAPGQTFQRGGSTCTCTAGGAVQCTVSRPGALRATCLLPEGGRLGYGGVYAAGAARCVCGEAGVLRCGGGDGRPACPDEGPVEDERRTCSCVLGALVCSDAAGDRPWHRSPRGVDPPWHRSPWAALLVALPLAALVAGLFALLECRWRDASSVGTGRREPRGVGEECCFLNDSPSTACPTAAEARHISLKLPA
ncbi:hypothetical protein DIPPA_26982 [Diplonema papillatum]|nr:hypothetical protein DIPPA_26982 [Diplonema papillatum]